MMVCILCLETEIDHETSIRIFSEEGVALGVKTTIAKHFWIEPKEELHQWICGQCWNCLLKFHEFYRHVEKAHENLKQTSQNLKTVNIISSEHDETRKDDSFSAQEVAIEALKNKKLVTKRKRGRPKSKKSHDVLEEIPIDTDLATMEDLNVETLDGIDLILKKPSKSEIDACNIITSIVKAEETSIQEVIEPVPKKKRGRPRGSVNQVKKKPASASSVKIKSEPEFHEFLDDDYDSQLVIATNDEESHGDSDMYCAKEDTKQKYSARRNLSLKYDEFIAKNYKLICNICQSPLEDFTKLKTHYRSEHKIRGYALCCGKKLLKRGVLVDHIHTHLNPEYFKCTECNKVMSDRRCLEGHMKTHEARGQPAFKCEICSKSFHRRVVYIRHVQNHMPENMKKFECPECSKKFATHYLMNQHNKIVHLNTYSKICDVCGKKIHGREALQRHQALHDNVPPPPIQCDLCGLRVTTKYGLTRHMKAKHIADYQKPQVCPYCSKVSPNFFAQKRHIYYMHNIKRRHACPMCEKAFKRSKDLREHMTTHTGDVLYTCPYCPKTFNSDANMYAHRKRVHRKEWEEKMKEKFPLINVKGEITNVITHNESEDTCFS